MSIQNLIIGAGPAGLAVAARMRKRGLLFQIIEQSNKIAPSWHNHYERLCLHTVKQYSMLPHIDFPDHYPLYVPRHQVVEYLENYAEHFDIKPQFNKSVKRISKGTKGNWQVALESANSLVAENVIVATGLNRIPNRPELKGEEIFQGTVEHSGTYKNAQPYKGKKVLVVGMGNSGAEIALDLSEQGAETFLSVRGPVVLVPRDLNGRPVQVTGKQLAKLPFGLGDWLGDKVRRIYFGDIRKYGLEPMDIAPTVLLREHGRTPTIDIGTYAAIKAGKIAVVKAIEQLSEKKVHFKDGRKEAIHHIVLATGYRAEIDSFLEKGAAVLEITKPKVDLEPFIVLRKPLSSIFKKKPRPQRAQELATSYFSSISVKATTPSVAFTGRAVRLGIPERAGVFGSIMYFGTASAT